MFDWKEFHSFATHSYETDTLTLITVLFSIPINKLPCIHYVSADEADEDDLGGGSLLGDRPRASSAASTRSVPDLPANSKRKKTPLTGTLGRKARKLLKGSKQKPEQQPSEVGIRNVGGQIHSAYRGHQVCNLINPSAAFRAGGTCGRGGRGQLRFVNGYLKLGG